jgi:hypothetical protein
LQVLDIGNDKSKRHCGNSTAELHCHPKATGQQNCIYQRERPSVLRTDGLANLLLQYVRVGELEEVSLELSFFTKSSNNVVAI